jgi:hypothetical protein
MFTLFGPESSLPRSQEHAIAPWPDSDVSITLAYFEQLYEFKIVFNCNKMSLKETTLFHLIY